MDEVAGAESEAGVPPLVSWICLIPRYSFSIRWLREEEGRRKGGSGCIRPPSCSALQSHLTHFQVAGPASGPLCGREAVARTEPGALSNRQRISSRPPGWKARSPDRSAELATNESTNTIPCALGQKGNVGSGETAWYGWAGVR